jgi:ATP-dependent DNA helicase PIF1
MELNSDQAAAFAAVKLGKNIFLTGPAGAGKSFLIRKIVEWANTLGKPIAITAMTGCAALLLGNKAKTLHSWASVGLGRDSADVLATSILKHPLSKRRWKKTDVLIIDEISMMQPDLFEKLDTIGKKIRGSSKPFGGIQLIACGDFFQLPPVTKGISGEMLVPGRFAFESPVWRAANLCPVVLSKIERQTDTAFQQLLNACRVGQPTEDTITLLKSRQGLDWKSRLIRPTLLFSRNADVDAINEKNIAALQKPLHMFDAKTTIEAPADDPSIEIPTDDMLERFVQRLDNDANYAAHLELCEGAQVMLLVNMDIEAGLVNGSRGVIIGFRVDGSPIVQFLHGDPIAIELHEWISNDNPSVKRYQIPLRVAYAITIHKSQGATLDCALVDIGSSTFEFGQAYVALSRVRDISSLYIWNLDPAKIKAHPTVTKFYIDLLETLPEPASPSLVKPRLLITCDELDAGWKAVVSAWADTDLGRSCLTHVAERQAVIKVYPSNILESLRITALRDVKVVILGQDPYHGPGQAHGLSFSVMPGTPLPPSLRNIRKELLVDIGEDIWPVGTGTLTPWANQGVLLLNTILTVEEGNPTSHAGIGWEDLTSRLLSAIAYEKRDDPVVFVAWGKYAQTVVHKLKLGPKHTVLAAAHPSPLSAHNGFFGSKPFTKTNAFLVDAGLEPIRWDLTVTLEKEDS